MTDFLLTYGDSDPSCGETQTATCAYVDLRRQIAHLLALGEDLETIKIWKPADIQIIDKRIVEYTLTGADLPPKEDA